MKLVHCDMCEMLVRKLKGFEMTLTHLISCTAAIEEGEFVRIDVCETCSNKYTIQEIWERFNHE